MADVATKRMTIDEFFVWQSSQEDLYELVDGVPVLYRAAQAMSGGSSMHDRIITNLIVAFDRLLGDGPCRPATTDLAIRTKIKSLRRADVIVTCDEPAVDVYEALDPRLVVEVLSPSNTGVSFERKLREYRRHQKLDYILLVDSLSIDVTLYTRTDNGWDDTDYARHGDIIDLPKLDCNLTLDDIYRRISLPSLPTV